MINSKVLCSVAAIAAALVLAGCAPSTAGGVRELGASRQYEFTVPQNYQPVYRKVLAQARKCFQMNLITAQMMVQSDLFTDIKSGTITLALHGALGTETYQVIDIKAIDDESTQISAHYSRGPIDVYGQALKAWVVEDATTCDGKA